ncbi:predicted protein [Haematococcus lacustris]|uniref:Uncharacterized protein n=1 Tax=Haematococcus lacustris TaxID=44745 RepID=A0A699ZK47_HAELA|nr:predicted protein [Haematococcus lacustris]
MATENDEPFEGLTEDDLMDDAEVDTMVREAITASVGDNQFLHKGGRGPACIELHAVERKNRREIDRAMGEQHHDHPGHGVLGGAAHQCEAVGLLGLMCTCRGRCRGRRRQKRVTFKCGPFHVWAVNTVVSSFSTSFWPILLLVVAQEPHASMYGLSCAT